MKLSLVPAAPQVPDQQLPSRTDELLRLAIEVGRIGIFETDLKQKRTRFSPRLCAILGLPSGTEMSSEHALQFVHQTITQRKQAEAQLRESEERLRIATSSAALGVFEWDVDSDQASWENDAPAAFTRPVAPKVMIVDDDVDLALAMQTALSQLGCEAVVKTKHEGLHRKIIACEADYILMDWKLNNQVTAGEVVEKAARVIDAFSDLRRKFTENKPRVVAYSVCDRDEITLPANGRDYFNHTDHWQKPMPSAKVISRASSLLNANA